MDFTTAELDDLVSLKTLSGLVELSPSGLGNLRKRHGDFPEPRLPNSRGGLFRVGDVVDWFATRRRGPRTIHPTLDWRWKRALDACQLDHELEPTRHFAVAVLAVLAGAPDSEPPTTMAGIRRQAAAVDADNPELAGALERLLQYSVEPTPTSERVLVALGQAVQAMAPPELLEDVLDYLAGIETAATVTTPDELADVLIAVGDPTPGIRLFDPAAGIGGLLLRAAEDTKGRIELHGFEEWAHIADLASARLFVHHVHAGLDAQDALDPDALPTEAFDLVLLDPPFKGRTTHRWLQAALQPVKEGGRAVLSLPDRTLAPGRRELDDLGPDRLPDAIVVCASGTRTDFTGDVAVWSVPNAANDRTLIVDARQIDTPPPNAAAQPSLDGASTEGVSDAVRRRRLQALRNALRRWRSGQEPSSDELDLPFQVVAAEDLHAADGDLRPERWCAPVVDIRPATKRALKLASELSQLVGNELSTVTTTEQRRALRRLTERLERVTGDAEPHSSA